MPEVVIIDYGIGNVRSILNAFQHLGIHPILTRDKDSVLNADAVILPGVGAFKHGMDNLKEFDLEGTIHSYVKTNKPFLGICLGMQMLFDESEEFGTSKGLGLIEGRVTKLPVKTNHKLKLPHIGWNDIENTQDINWSSSVLKGLSPGTSAYFVHSFAAVPAKKENILATANYGGVEFCCATWKNNIYGLQFHPEKSGKDGLKMLQNFISLI